MQRKKIKKKMHYLYARLRLMTRNILDIFDDNIFKTLF